MFLKNSRYADLPTVAVPNPHGEGEVAMVKLRRLPQVTGEPRAVKAPEQLDAIAEAAYGDATRYWRIADAHTEIEAAQLTRRPGRVIDVPKD